jgi:hypothetical protein
LTREEAAMKEAVGTQTPTTAGDPVLSGLRRRLAELEAWEDGPVKELARGAVRGEMARVGRQLTELEWRWI